MTIPMTKAEVSEVIDALRSHTHRMDIEKKRRRANTSHKLLLRLIGPPKERAK